MASAGAVEQGGDVNEHAEGQRHEEERVRELGEEAHGSGAGESGEGGVDVVSSERKWDAMGPARRLERSSRLVLTEDEVRGRMQRGKSLADAWVLVPAERAVARMHPAEQALAAAQAERVELVRTETARAYTQLCGVQNKDEKTVAFAEGERAELRERIAVIDAQLPGLREEAYAAWRAVMQEERAVQAVYVDALRADLDVVKEKVVELMRRDDVREEAKQAELATFDAHFGRK